MYRGRARFEQCVRQARDILDRDVQEPWINPRMQREISKLLNELLFLKRQLNNPLIEQFVFATTSGAHVYANSRSGTLVAIDDAPTACDDWVDCSVVS